MTTPDRRAFLQTTTAATLAAGFAAGVHAAGSATLKVGLVGCGARGTGAAANALAADADVKLTAMGDMFADRLDKCYHELGKDGPAKLDVPPDRKFVGFDAYKQVIDSGVDVVVLATPPGFRPMHLDYAVKHDKHVFCEKPVAVDGPGIRSVLATAEEAKRRGKCLVSGFCFRYDLPKRETVQRVHDGAIGDVVAIQANYLTGNIWSYAKEPAWSDMEYQLRNWYYYTWLSGDLIVEQHVHNLDKAAWVMKEAMPVAATGLGGRQVRTGDRFGHIYDHHAVVFEYANGTKLFSNCRQMPGCQNDVSDHVMGSKGAAHLMKHEITGDKAWKYRGKAPSMYQVEHDELFAAIRAGKVLNDGAAAARSTLMAILGRMATYTGKRVTWEQALNSTENLLPAKLEFGPAATPAVAMPGVTKLA